MVVLRDLIKNKVEEQMLPFINLMENFSKSGDDIITIMDRANQYMKEPLREIINDFVMDVRLYADMEKSFDVLLKKLEGTKLRDVIKNIQICSMHDSDYSEVLQDARASIKEYLKSKAIRNAIKNSARVDVTALLVAGILIVQILNSFLSDTVIHMLFSSYIGIGIILYCVIVVLVAVYVLFGR